MIQQVFKTFLVFLFTLSLIQAQDLSINTFVENYNAILKAYVNDGKVNYRDLKQDENFISLVAFTKSFNPKSLNDEALKAYRINNYNIQVINGIVEAYPISTVQDITGFFDRNQRTIENMSITLNDYEKKYILQKFKDPRLHFVLVCGALGCPPIIPMAYDESRLNEQLNQQTQIALRNPEFIKISYDQVKISQIFQWYASDFGSNNNRIIDFINNYREDKLPAKSFSYYSYDWTLNDTDLQIIGNQPNSSNSANRYVVSAAIPKGSYEFKVFNNLYSQNVNDFRSNFFTTTFSGLYGLTRNFNLGIAGRYRVVTNHSGNSSPLNVFGGANPVSKRNGLTGIGPMIRYAPVPKWENFSIQSSFTFSIGNELEGENGKAYIDYNGGVFHTQLFNDFTLSNKFSLFTEIDFLLEGIGFPTKEFSYRFSTPVISIFSYFPTPKSTLYVLAGYTPYWESPYDYFFQSGLGSKYQITNQFEIELLFTVFRNKFILREDGDAQTFNFGLRYTL